MKLKKQFMVFPLKATLPFKISLDFAPEIKKVMWENQVTNDT